MPEGMGDSLDIVQIESDQKKKLTIVLKMLDILN